MDNDVINVFDTPDNSDMILPGQTNKSSEELISKDIDEQILGETVKSIMIPEDNGFIYPNYVIDFSNIDSVDPIQLIALNSLLRDNGDTAIYIYNQGGIQKIGMGYNETLNRLLAPCTENIFNGKCRVYRDFDPNSPVVIVTTKDITHMRLSI